MKIIYREKLKFGFIDMLNDMSWSSAAISITIAGLSMLWGTGTFFIIIAS